MNSDSSDEGAPEAATMIENTYPFTLLLEDGTKEVIQVPRVTTRIKYRLGLGITKMPEETKEEDLAEFLIDKLVPGLMDRIGMKSPQIETLGALTNKIIAMDGDMIFGKGWRKKAMDILKKGEPKKKKKKKKVSKKKRKN